MKVNNNFPNVDRVLAKLREFVKVCEARANSSSQDKDICKNALGLVDAFVDSIGRYLDSVCNGDDRIARFRSTGPDTKELQEMVAAEDSARTSNHSNIIINMIMIDRIASRLGLQRVFDYAEEFQNDFFSLTPSTPEGKSKMSERARVKRRELGNFGLYIGASVTAGMSKEHLISDEEAREFASCEDDVVKASPEIMQKVKMASRGYKKNMDSIIE